MKHFLAIFFVLLSLWGMAKGLGNGANPGPTVPYRHERFFTTFGYGVSFPNYNKLNYVVDKYNTRPGLSQAMRHIKVMQGFTISLGSTNDSYLLEFSYTQRRASTQGRENTQGYVVTRDISLRDNKLAAGLSTRVYQNGRFKFYVGGMINVGYMNIYSRSYRSIDNTKQPLAKVGIGDLQLGLAIVPQVHFSLDKAERIRLVARPYFNFEFLEAYYGDLNKAINPATYTEDNNNNLYNRPWSTGLEIKFYVSI